MRKKINKYKNQFDMDDEFFTRKRKAKMHLIGTILSSMVGGVIFFFVMAWLQDNFAIIQIKSVEQLQEINGKFIAEYHSSRPAYYDIHIQDDKTGKDIALNTDLCASPMLMKKYDHDVVTVWYGENQNPNKKMVYQMQVKDKIVYDINETNKRVQDYNVGVYVSYLTYIFMFLGVVAASEYLDIKKYYSKIYKGEFDYLNK